MEETRVIEGENNYDFQITINSDYGDMDSSHSTSNSDMVEENNDCIAIKQESTESEVFSAHLTSIRKIMLKIASWSFEVFFAIILLLKNWEGVG